MATAAAARRVPALALATLLSAVLAGANHTCTKKVAFTEQAFDVEYKPVLRTYYERCWMKRCSKTRVSWQTVKTSRVLLSYRTEVDCCPGYARASQSHDCKPVCEGGCPSRKQCSAPSRCTCQDGYLAVPADNSCVSPCELRGCEHGVCTDLHTCVCETGYSQGNGSYCKPVCPAGCGNNARCVAPGRCRCLEGYGGLDSSGCRPLCRLQTRGAECVDTERYQCLPGYVFHKQTETEYTCRPTCRDGCENGECVAPDTCSCLDGYELASRSTCIPICRHVCSHGDCVAPDTCRCHPGYRLDPQDGTNSTCLPTCQADCVNGRCTAPDTCTCFVGYVGPTPSNSSLESSRNYSTNAEAGGNVFNNTCLPVCPSGCRQGVCALPDTCECLDGHELDPADASNSTCRPTCERTCVNANCTAPDMCSCLEGFQLDPSDLSNSTCQPISQSLALCTGDGCPASGETSRTMAIAGGVGAVAILALMSTVAAAVCWRKRRTGKHLVERGDEGYSNPAFGEDERLQFGGQMLEESNVDSED